MEPAMDKADLIRELEARQETLRRLAAAVPQPPNPRPQESDSSLRRKIARLRSGEICPADTAVDSATLADMMERELEYRDRVRELMRELDDLGQLLGANVEATAAGLLAQILSAFHAARHLPEAADPNSDLSEWIRLVERERRAEFGRRRRKK